MPVLRRINIRIPRSTHEWVEKIRPPGIFSIPCQYVIYQKTNGADWIRGLEGFLKCLQVLRSSEWKPLRWYSSTPEHGDCNTCVLYSTRTYRTYLIHTFRQWQEISANTAAATGENIERFVVILVLQKTWTFRRNIMKCTKEKKCSDFFGWKLKKKN